MVEGDVMECLGLTLGGVTDPPPMYLGLADEFGRTKLPLFGEIEANLGEFPEDSLGEVFTLLLPPIFDVLNGIPPPYLGETP